MIRGFVWEKVAGWQELVRTTFPKLVLTCHPDKFGNDPEKTAIYRQIGTLYSLLYVVRLYNVPCFFCEEASLASSISVVPALFVSGTHKVPNLRVGRSRDQVLQV